MTSAVDNVVIENGEFCFALSDREYVKQELHGSELPPGAVIDLEWNERAIYANKTIYVIAKRPRRWFRR